MTTDVYSVPTDPRYYDEPLQRTIKEEDDMSLLRQQLQPQKRLLISQCRNTPLSPELTEWFKKSRQNLIDHELMGLPLPILFPSDSYAMIFLLRPDDTIRLAISTLLSDERHRIRRNNEAGTATDAQGFIYAFWIEGQPLDQIKIGRTTQTTNKRVADWDASLSNEMGHVVNLLFAFPTRYNELAERLIQVSLTCERIGKLRHPRTGRELVEFFQIDNAVALRLFMALCVRYADSIGDQLRAQ